MSMQVANKVHGEAGVHISDAASASSGDGDAVHRLVCELIDRVLGITDLNLYEKS